MCLIEPIDAIQNSYAVQVGISRAAHKQEVKRVHELKSLFKSLLSERKTEKSLIVVNLFQFFKLF